MKKKIKCELYNDNFQSWKQYPIHKAQLVIADIPYNIGKNFYGSNPLWYNGGDNANGESKLAGRAAFPTDFNFNIAEYFHFCNQLLKKEPKKGGERGRSSDAPCMIVFHSYEQAEMVKRLGEKHGFIHTIPLVFIKHFSPQVLKANMRIVGATEYATVLYRSYLPKFRNNHKMIYNWFEWEPDGSGVPKIHPTQKPVKLLKKLISIFTDEGDVVIDPCAGSGSTLRAAYEMRRHSYGFELNKKFYREAVEKMLVFPDKEQMDFFDLLTQEAGNNDQADRKNKHNTRSGA